MSLIPDRMSTAAAKPVTDAGGEASILDTVKDTVEATLLFTPKWLMASTEITYCPLGKLSRVSFGSRLSGYLKVSDPDVALTR